jgi:integrase
MPTVRDRNGRWQVIIRRDGQNWSKNMPQGMTKTDAYEWGLEQERKPYYGETPTIAKKALKPYTLANLIQGYIAKVETALRNRRDPDKPMYVYGEQLKRSWEIEIIRLKRLLTKEKQLTNKTLDQFTDDRHWSAYCDKRLNSGEVGPDALYKERSALAYVWNKEGIRTLRLPLKEGKEIFKGPKREKNARERYLRPSEYAPLYEAIECCKGLKQQQLWAMLIKFVLSTGIRRGDLVNLTWSNIDMDELTITIPSTTTKGGKTYVIPITGDLHAWLLRYQFGLSDRETEPNARVFPLSENAIRIAFTRISKRAKLWISGWHSSNLTFHCLRRTAIQNFPLTTPEKQYMSGHKPDQVLHIHYDNNREQLIETIRKKLEAADEILFKNREWLLDYDVGIRYWIPAANERIPEGRLWTKKEGRIVRKKL